MSTRHHTRGGSCGRRLNTALTKPSRLTAGAKRLSANQVPTLPHNATVALSRPAARSEARAESPGSEWDSDQEPEDMASFLQFCATCEKQIVTPINTVLYCSEACKRRDSAKSIPTATHYSPPLSPYASTPSSSHNYYPHTTIVPQRSPTVLRPLSTTFSELSLYELNPDRKGSPDILDESTFGMPTQSRPYLTRASTSDETNNVPSLVHTPSSSYGAATPAAIDSARPLPRKHSCTAHRGIDLVTPVMMTPVTTTITTMITITSPTPMESAHGGSGRASAPANDYFDNTSERPRPRRS